jgi:hypothetical protein
VSLSRNQSNTHLAFQLLRMSVRNGLGELKWLLGAHPQVIRLSQNCTSSNRGHAKASRSGQKIGSLRQRHCGCGYPAPAALSCARKENMSALSKHISALAVANALATSRKIRLHGPKFKRRDLPEPIHDIALREALNAHCMSDAKARASVSHRDVHMHKTSSTWS